MNRTDIIQTAAQIFRQKGYHAASMQDIADAVGLQKASLYHHVAGKQDILAAILDAALDRLIGEMQSVLGRDVTPQEKLRLAMEAYIGQLTSEADLAAVLLLEHRSLEPPLREAHIERRDRFDRLWRQIVREGIEAGAFRPVDETVVAFALLGVQNWLITWYRSNGRFRPRVLADQFADVFLKGLLADGRSSARNA